MARTTPAQKPRGEHSSTFSGGFWSVADPVAAVMRIPGFNTAIEMALCPAAVKQGARGDAGVTVGRYDPEDAAPAGGNNGVGQAGTGFWAAAAAGGRRALGGFGRGRRRAQDYPQRVVT